MIPVVALCHQLWRNSFLACSLSSSALLVFACVITLASEVSTLSCTAWVSRALCVLLFGDVVSPCNGLHHQVVAACILYPQCRIGLLLRLASQLLSQLHGPPVLLFICAHEAHEALINSQVRLNIWCGQIMLNGSTFCQILSKTSHVVVCNVCDDQHGFGFLLLTADKLHWF